MGLYDQSGADRRLTATEIARGLEITQEEVDRRNRESLLNLSPLVERLTREFPVLDDLRKPPPPRLVLAWELPSVSHLGDVRRVRLVQHDGDFFVEHLVKDRLGAECWQEIGEAEAFHVVARELTRRCT